MAWQGCCGRGCKTKWPKTHFSNWFNRLDWNPGKLCISTVFHVVQACAKRKKMFVAFIGFLMCSLMKSGFGIAATLSFAENFLQLLSLSLSDIYFWSQTLDIVAENPDRFKVVALAAGSNVTLLADQVSCIFTNENA
jgi:hypothetical protein